MNETTLAKRYQQGFEVEFARLIGHYYGDAARAKLGPSLLPAACHYALSGSGKRVRPVLVLLVNHMAAGHEAHAWAPACAIEMVHTYSLVHDDLPCMDDDDLRRGRPTTHVVYDEVTALLAGDALLTDAFALLADGEELWGPGATAEARLRMQGILAKAAGGTGMVLGQALDIHWTQRDGATADDLDAIHRQKTGRLLGAACALGGLAAGISKSEVAAMQEMGELAGLAFQIIDDLLDQSSHTGKSQGKDAIQGKLTYASFYDQAHCQQRANDLTERALAFLTPYGEAAAPTRAFLLSLLKRQH